MIIETVSSIHINGRNLRFKECCSFSGKKGTQFEESYPFYGKSRDNIGRPIFYMVNSPFCMQKRQFFWFLI